jgi:hypothetical protein
MSNGNTLNSIEQILTGADEIPQHVSNRLLLLAMREQYMLAIADRERVAKLEQSHAEHCLQLRTQALSIADNHDEINRLRTRSNWSDGALAVITAIAAAFGIAK